MSVTPQTQAEKPRRTPQARRRWLQFSLRTLFIGMTVAGFGSLAAPAVIAWLFPPKPSFDEIIQELDRAAAESQKAWDAMGPVVYPDVPACLLILEKREAQSDPAAPSKLTDPPAVP